MSCGCNKKKGEAGYGKGKKSAPANMKGAAKPAAGLKKMGKKK